MIGKAASDDRILSLSVSLSLPLYFVFLFTGNMSKMSISLSDLLGLPSWD